MLEDGLIGIAEVESGYSQKRFQDKVCGLHRLRRNTEAIVFFWWVLVMGMGQLIGRGPLA